MKQVFIVLPINLGKEWFVAALRIMIGTRERVLPESSRNVWFQFFDLQIRFNHNALNLNISHNHVRIYTSVRKSWRDESPMESIEILDDVSFRLILKDWGSTWQCLPVCWSWYMVGGGGGWGSEKEVATE